MKQYILSVNDVQERVRNKTLWNHHYRNAMLAFFFTVIVLPQERRLYRFTTNLRKDCNWNRSGPEL